MDAALNVNSPLCYGLCSMKRLVIMLCLCALTACTAMPPRNSDNLCATFKEKDDWYEETLHSYQKWGVPIPVQMAIMHQESHFVADAKPPREWLLGFIPWFRPSSAYGYAQALDKTWQDYLDKTGSWAADRDDFGDASDFIGWYCAVSHNQLGIPKGDAKNLFLAYHEGNVGYKHKTYLNKAGLTRIAEKVANRARLFKSQLEACKINY